MQEKNYKTEHHITVRDFTVFGKDEFNKTLPEALNENVVSTMSINEQTEIFFEYLFQYCKQTSSI